MKILNEKISEYESAISCLLENEDVSRDDAVRIGDLLGLILSTYFSTLSKDTGMRGWSVDDMYPIEFYSEKNKLTLIGDIHWLSGGDSCDHFQADIAKYTHPMLYSVKLKSARLLQTMYVAKTYDGWILNAT